MKLWLRVNTDAVRDPRVGQLAERLGIPLRHGFGLVVATWAAMLEHVPSGDITHVSDSMLDSWAGYTARRGRPNFGSVFRELFTTDGVDTQFADNQAALVERQERERQRWHRRKTAIDSRGDSAETPALRNATQRNGKELTPQLRAGGTSEAVRAEALAAWSRILGLRERRDTPHGVKYSLSRAVIATLPERDQRALELAGGTTAVVTTDEVALRTNRAAFRDAYVGTDVQP